MAVRVSIVCDNCGAWEYGGGAVRKAKARQYVLKNCPGWKSHCIGRRLVDLCPNCEGVEPLKRRGDTRDSCWTIRGETYTKWRRQLGKRWLCWLTNERNEVVIKPTSGKRVDAWIKEHIHGHALVAD